MSSLPFHPAIEGLRGLALLAVLLFHAEMPGVGGGFLGVSTFFTLSGFLITGLLVDEGERTGRVGLRRFWARRLRRLMPAALAGLLAIALLGSAFGDVAQQERLRADGIASLAYVANWWLIASDAGYADLMGSPSWVQHFWSLAIEEQYYALFPLLALGVARAGRRRLLAGLLALGIVGAWAWMVHLAAGPVSTARIYYGSDTRCAELLLGGLLALVVSGRPGPAWLRRAAPVWGGLGVAVSLLLWSRASVESAWLYTWGLPLHGLASLGVLLGCIADAGPVRLALASPPMRWLGRVSYGAYVYHWPIYLVLDAERTGLDGVALLALRLVVTGAVAEVSHRWLEEPVRRRRRLPGWRGGLAVPVAIAAVAATFHATRPSAALPAVVEQAVPLRAGAPRVAVVGDSLARNIAEGLGSWADRTGAIDLEDLSLPGCGFARGAWPDPGDRRRTVCDRWPNIVGQRLGRLRPDLVVAVSGGWDLDERRVPGRAEPVTLGDPAFDRWITDQYATAARVLSSRGARVVWLTTPCFRKPFGRQLGIFDPFRPEHLRRAVLPAVRSRSRAVVQVIDLHAKVCPGGRFTNSLEGIEPFRPDGIHFSPRGGRWVGEWLGPELVRIWQLHGGRAAR